LGGVLAGCGSKPESAVAEAKKFRPVDDSSPAGEATADGTGAGTAGNIARAGFASESGAAQESPTGAGATPPGPTPQDPAIGGDLREILNKINRLAQQQPQGRTEREQLESLMQVQTQRLGLAKQALKLNPPAELKRQLVIMMHNIYQMFAEYRVPSAMAQITDFGKTMSADPDPEIARIGRHATFSANLSRIASQQLESGKEIVAEVQKLLDAEQGKLSRDTVEAARDTANLLRQGGFREDAAAIYDALAAALANDPEQKEHAKGFAVQAKIMKLDLNTVLEDVIRERPDADKKLQAAVQSLLSEDSPNRELFAQVQQLAHILEALGHFELAQSTYDQIAAAFKDTSDKELADQIAETASKAKQRMALVGQPFTVEGVQVDGSPFDWSAYAGKVVLVDFWASWCGPCLQEIPNIRENFEQYHAKGFDVVGVNLNTKLADLKQFLALQGQEIPWATVTSQVVLDGQAGEDWTQIPMAAKAGVQAIPFVVLIGKDGKVDSIHVRGPKLGARLKELLGDPITSEVPADPTQPAKPPAKATGQRSRAISPLGAAVATALVAAEGLFTATALVAFDPPENAAAEDASNPYLAKPGLNPSELIAFIQKMLDRPQSIQTRPGFAEAIVEACDRVMKAEAATKSEQLLAIQTKLAMLHREACDGKEAADKQLMAFVEELKGDDRPEVAREVTFFRLERRVLEAKELPLDEVPALLKDVQSYMANEKLSGKHLRLASSTVAAINRLESGDEREAQFVKFGQIFSKSGDKEMARYGKKLAKKSSGDVSKR
jgi:thiol-disulfide isomerase/thioredoxin